MIQRLFLAGSVGNTSALFVRQWLRVRQVTNLLLNQRWPILLTHRWVLIKHFRDVIMGAMASQITSLIIVYSTVYWGTDRRKHQCSASLAFVEGIHTGEFPAQMASNAENVSIWWRHHDCYEIVMLWNCVLNHWGRYELTLLANQTNTMVMPGFLSRQGIRCRFYHF